MLTVRGWYPGNVQSPWRGWRLERWFPRMKRSLASFFILRTTLAGISTSILRCGRRRRRDAVVLKQGVFSKGQPVFNLYFFWWVKVAGREKHIIKANGRRMFDLAEMNLANLNLSTLKLHAEMQIVRKLYGYNLLSSRKLFSVNLTRQIFFFTYLRDLFDIHTGTRSSLTKNHLWQWGLALTAPF